MTTPDPNILPEQEPEAFLPQPQPSAAELMAAIANLAGRIPTLEQVERAAETAAQRIVDARMAKAEAEAANAIEDFQRKTANAQTQHANGHSQNGHAELPGPQPQAALPGAGSGGNKLGGSLEIAKVIGGLLTDNMVPMTNTWLDIQMKREQIKLMQSDPITMAQAMFTLNPQKAQFVGMMLAPDMLKQMYPNMVSSAVDATAQAMRAGMLRSGWQPPGNPAAGPGGKGAWVIEGGRKLWDPEAPIPQPTDNRGGPSQPQTLTPTPNPLGNPLVIDATKVPGFGVSPAPSGGQPGSSVPTPNAGANPSGQPSSAPSGPSSPSTASPNVSSGGNSSVPSSPSNPAPVAVMGNSILLQLRH